MIDGTRDLTYGSCSAKFTVLPDQIAVGQQDSDYDGTEIHFLGRRAAGVHMLAGDTPCLIVENSTTFRDPISYGNSKEVVWAARPQRTGDGSGEKFITQILTGRDRDTRVVATCAVSPAKCAVLLQEPWSGEYSLQVLDGTTQLRVADVAQRPIPPSVLPAGATSCCMAENGGTIVIATTRDTGLRITTVPAQGAITFLDLNLVTAQGRLQGMTNLFAASIQFTGTGLSLALTAQRLIPDPGGPPGQVVEVSQGCILRLLDSSHIDANYGENGLWVAPLRVGYEAFRCMGETPHGIVGHTDSRFVLYGVVPDGGHIQDPDNPDGLDSSSGTLGIAEVDFGQSVRQTVESCVTTSDATWAYLAGDAVVGGNPQVVVTRFAVATGVRDMNFGTSGLVTVRIDGPAEAPRSLLLVPAGLLVALSRRLETEHPAAMPGLVWVDPVTGAQITESLRYGYGGLALASRLGPPAAVTATGKVYMTSREVSTFADPVTGVALDDVVKEPDDDNPVHLRIIDEDGTSAPPVFLSLQFAYTIDRLTPLADGSLLVSGSSAIIVEHPVYNYLVLTRWSGAGLRDTTDPAAVQELGANPCLYWYATGVQQESPTTLIAFGGGGTRWDRTVTVAGHTYTDSSSRTPGPALFRISHPQGLDTTFGDGGIAVIPVPDLNPSVFAGYLDGRTQCTLAFADLTSYQTRTVTGLERFRSSLGGAVRFV